MKKSLTMIVASAMAFSAFASAAFADDKALDTQGKFDALKAAGIFSGYPDGSAGLDKEMTRAEFAKVLALLDGLDLNAGASSYTDVVANHWARGYIGAVTEAKLMNGLGDNKFGPSGKVTVEQIAKVADILAGISPEGEAAGTSAWAKGYVAAAVKAGLIPQMDSYTGNATRSLLVDVAFDLSQDVVSVKETKIVDDKNIEVTFSDGGVVKKTLDTALVSGQSTKVTVEYQGKSYTVEVKLDVVQAVSAKQTGVKAITVEFNQPVLASEQSGLTYELKSGLSTFPVTAKFSDDNKSAVLTAAYLPAGDYTLTVKGSDAISLKVAAEVATKIDITSVSLQKATNQDLGVKIYNQFGEAMSASAQVTSYNVTKAKQLADGNTIDLSADANAAIGDSILVTAVYPAAGLSTNKTLKVINGSAATSIKIDDVKPLTDNARIYVNQSGFVLPLTLVDAEGKTVNLPVGSITPAGGSNSVTYAGLIFYISNTSIISGLSVDSNGVVTFNTTGTSGNVTIVVTNGATGASATTTIAVNPVAKVKQFQLGAPTALVVKGETVTLPFTAVDTYGAAIDAKSVDLSNVKFNAFGSEITPTLTAKGELQFTFGQTGSTTIYVYVDGVLQQANVPVTVNDVAYSTAVNGITGVATTLEDSASVEFDQDNIQVVDNYGRVTNVAAGVYGVSSSNDNIVKYVGGKLVAVAPGSATITVSSTANANISNYTFTVNVVASSDVKTYAIDTIGTVYGVSPANSAYAKSVTLVGKTASGTTVALVSNAPTFVTSSDESVLKVTGAAQVSGLKAGKSTVAAYLNGSKVAEQEVTVSDAAPVITTVSLDNSEYTTTVGGTVTIVPTVNDQYGVAVTGGLNSVQVGDSSIATVSGLTITGVKHGTTTLTYIASNGMTATATIVVN